VLAGICLQARYLVTSSNDVLTIVVCIRCCENVYGVVDLLFQNTKNYDIFSLSKDYKKQLEIKHQ
jgi:hypothetical protein